MAQFGLLSAIEVRLVTRLLEQGAFAEAPVARRRAPSESAGRRAARLGSQRGRLTAIAATRQVLGSTTSYGSYRELLAIGTAAMTRPTGTRGLPFA